MDLTPLTRLHSALSAAQTNTSHMITKLQDFESRLEKLDQQMLPIQTVSQQCQQVSPSFTVLTTLPSLVEHSQTHCVKKKYWINFLGD